MADLGFGASVQSAPGVYTREFDLTTTPASGASSTGAIAGVFGWGPVDSPRLLGLEDQLATIFGPPTNLNAETWFVAANFLSYGNSLYVNRVADTTNSVFSAVAASSNVTSIAAHTVKNAEDFEVKQPSFESAVSFIAKFPGDRGNSLRVSVCASPTQYSSTINLQSVGSNTSFADANTGFTIAVGSKTATIRLANTAALTGNTPGPYANTVASSIAKGDLIVVGNNSIGTQTLKIVSIGTPVIANTAGANSGTATIAVNFDQPLKIAGDFVLNTISRKWEFSGSLGVPVTTTSTALNGNTAAVDSMHVVVVDEAGKFSGRPGAVLEMFEHLSRATDSTTADNEANYYKTVLNNRSSYVWAANDPTGVVSNTALLVVSTTATAPFTTLFAGGTDGADESNVPLATVMLGFDKFNHKDKYNLSAIIVGKTRGGSYGEQLFNYVLDNVGDKRRDVVVYGSPSKEAVVNNADPLAALLAFRGSLRRTTYGFLESSYKYMYDKYNDKFRYVPLCGDTAGLSSRADVTNDPWISPAGYNRGQYKNLVKVSYNPSPSDQGVLFSNDINCVVTTDGEGTFLLGDKTLLGQQSALNQLGTRKMLNILKGSIAKYAKSLMFEINDEFTQSLFKSKVEPYLRDIQGRRGISRFGVVSDDSVNTEAVVNANQFVGNIFFVPTRSIRTITLNFVAVGTNVEFDELVS